VLLGLLAREGVPLTAAQVRERCDDAWAPPLVDEWLSEAFDRGLVKARRHADFPIEWKLTAKGERAARRV
jgi:hypothetical protein